MAVYEALLLNTVVPQIQAAQAGDSYVMVVNATTPALRITQTGTGDSILVEDAANPDATPFVVTATGSVGIGLSSPEGKLHVANTGTAGTTADNLAVYFTSTNRNANLYIRAKNTEGSVLNFADGDSDVVGRIAYEHSDNSMRFDVSGGEKMRLNSSGNLGLGVTPSAWGSTFKAMQFGTWGAIARESGNGWMLMSNNAYWESSSSARYIGNFNASFYLQALNGQHQWWYAAAGTAGDAISFTQAMTLDASGNLGVANTSPSSYNAAADNLVIGSSGSNGMTIVSGTTGAGYIMFADGTVGQQAYEGQITYDHASNFMAFNTSGIERARITSGGNLLVGTDNAAENAGPGMKVLNTGGTVALVSSASDSSQQGFEMYSTGAAAYRLYVNYAGTINATNTTISAISDQRLKENIQDLDVGLNAVMALKPRKFDWKAGKGKDIKGDRGWIAQEFEQVFPDMIDTWRDPAPEGEEPYKSVRADLIPVLVKAIQEQQAIISDLTARLSALEAK